MWNYETILGVHFEGDTISYSILYEPEETEGEENPPEHNTKVILEWPSDLDNHYGLMLSGNSIYGTLFNVFESDIQYMQHAGYKDETFVQKLTEPISVNFFNKIDEQKIREMVLYQPKDINDKFIDVIAKAYDGGLKIDEAVFSVQVQFTYDTGKYRLIRISSIARDLAEMERQKRLDRIRF